MKYNTMEQLGPGKDFLELAPKRPSGTGWFYCQAVSRGHRSLCGDVAAYVIQNDWHVCIKHYRKLQRMAESGKLEVIPDPRDSKVNIVRVLREGETA